MLPNYQQAFLWFYHQCHITYTLWYFMTVFKNVFCYLSFTYKTRAKEFKNLVGRTVTNSLTDYSLFYCTVFCFPIRHALNMRSILLKFQVQHIILLTVDIMLYSWFPEVVYLACLKTLPLPNGNFHLLFLWILLSLLSETPDANEIVQHFFCDLLIALTMMFSRVMHLSFNVKIPFYKYEQYSIMCTHVLSIS